MYLKRLGVPFPESPKIRMEPKREGACGVCVCVCVCVRGWVSVCVSVCARACACVRYCVRACVHACVSAMLLCCFGHPSVTPPPFSLTPTPQRHTHTHTHTAEELWFDNWALAWGQAPADWYAEAIVPESQKLAGTFPQEFVDKMHRQITTRKRTMYVCM